MPRKGRKPPQNTELTTPETPAPAVCRLRLFVARPTPSSMRAEANLAAALAAMENAGAFEVEIVDVLKDPHQAVKNRIIVTPCLLQVGVTPARTLVGDLQDAEMLRVFLERVRAGAAT